MPTVDKIWRADEDTPVTLGDRIYVDLVDLQDDWWQKNQESIVLVFSETPLPIAPPQRHINGAAGSDTADVSTIVFKLPEPSQVLSNVPAGAGAQVGTWDLWGSLHRDASNGMVRVRLALEEGTVFPTKYKKWFFLPYAPVPRFKLIVWGMITLFLVCLVVLLGARTELLRERGELPRGDGEPNSFSLSRTQLAFWLIVIMSSFILIWLVTAREEFSTTALVLLGISMGTTVTAIGVGQIPQNAARQAKAKIKAEPRNKDIDLESQPDDEDPPDVKLVKARYQAAKAGQQPRKSRGFWMDILSDDSQGISIGRLQNVLWTLLLGTMFAWHAYMRYEMREFSATLLALMAVSGTGYLGTKYLEQRKPINE